MKARHLEVASNAAILLVAILIVTVVFREHRLTGQQLTSHPAIKVGEQVPLKNVDWSANSTTLVFGLNTQCHFCTASAPFYKDLVTKVSRKKDLHLLAVLPQPEKESREYLGKLGVGIEDVREQNLASIPIGGTPTLLLVDARGRVTQSWVGKLTPESEAKVLESLGCKGPSCS
jgi:hypothetical protein